MTLSHCYFPAIQSILDPQALLAQIDADYDVGTPVDCKLWKPSRNDTYRVKTADNAYILRIYPAQRRQRSEIFYELELLNYLKQKNTPVSIPIERSDGTYLITLDAVEGVRYGVLFEYAEGDEGPSLLDEPYSLLYGRALAELHTSLDGFSSQQERLPLNFDLLLDSPLQALLPLLEHRPADAAYLRWLVETLKTRLMNLPISELDYGVCHGDTHGGNAHFAQNQKVTFFDFDDCGLGWRAYDLATFRWNLFINNQDETIWQAFLQGYQQKRTIHERDLAAVPLFVVVRAICLAGQQGSLASHWGFEFVQNKYFDDEVRYLKKQQTELGL